MYRHLPAAALLAALMLPAARAAQPAETLIVSASRIPIPAAESGGSVSVIERAEIERRQQIFAAELLTLSPGVNVSRSGGYGSQTQLRMRGAEANQVLVLIDGVEANDPAGNDEFAIEHLTSFDIERIEVVRGPQSALWGSNALAGVVNIITRQPGDRLEAEAFAEAGAFDTVHAGARISGPAGPVRAAFGLSRVDSDGTNVARTGGEDDAYDNTTASLNLLARPGDRVDVAFTGRITDATKAFDTTDFLVTGLPADSVEQPESDIRLGYFGATATLAPGDWAWTHSLRTSWATSDTDISELAAGGGRVETSQVAADRYGLQYQVTWRPEGALETFKPVLTLAVDQEWQDFRQRGAATPFGDPNQDQDLDNTGAVAELRLAPAEGLVLAFSGRHDDNSDFDDIDTYRASAAWEPGVLGTRFRGSLGKGQKAPTFVERFGFFPDQFVGNPDLTPETSRAWEVGVDQPLWSGRLSLGATYYHEDLEDEINGFVFDPDLGEFGAFTADNLDGTSERRGVELTADAQVTPELELRANYTYTDARQPSTADSGTDQREIRRPRHSASLNGAYTFAAGRATVDLGIAYTGDRVDNFFEVAPPFGVQVVELDPYTLASVALTWRALPTLDLVTRVENAFNASYEDVYGYNTPGIGAYVGFRTRLAR